MPWNRSHDVVVVGFGGAGAAAAITAHDLGAEVVILEKMPQSTAGGNTRVSGNVWFNPTSVETAALYLRSLAGEYPIPDSLVWTWAQETSRNTTWVQSLGVETGILELPYEFPDLPGHESEDGWHHVLPSMGGGRLFSTLKAAVEARGIEVLYESPAGELIQDGAGGRVVGVRARAGGEELLVQARRGVVLASGGFENNQQMIRDFLRLPHAHPWGTPAATGDGIKMAQKAGADLWHMHNFMGRMGLKAPEFETAFNVEFPSPGWILVGSNGKRLVDEALTSRHGKARINGRYEPYPATMMYAIFDETTRLAGALSIGREDSLSSWNRVVERYRWSSDNRAEIEKGWIARGDTPGELASMLGIDPDGLDTTVSAFNSFCDAGRDPQFERSPETLIALRQPPFYGFAWGPVIVYTAGGPRRDEQARVLDPFGAPISGLYCAGEISATYSWCMSGGQMIADALAFGRIAGREAAAHD
jgi:succinate dehydrogenase/fumarate reductase flavoprotein subunit